jgi:hypothetical protein
MLRCRTSEEKNGQDAEKNLLDTIRMPTPTMGAVENVAEIHTEFWS